VSDLASILDSWLAEHADGIACVIGDPTFAATPRVRSLTPELSKGLEFDLVVLVDPEAFGTGVEGAVDRYVAMTRATQRLVISRLRESTTLSSSHEGVCLARGANQLCLPIHILYARARCCGVPPTNRFAQIRTSHSDQP